MNIHPLFVHFPIGLLATYSVIEVFGRLLPWLRRQEWLFGAKALLLIAGTLAAFVAVVTGGMAEDVVKASSSPRAFIIIMHEPFALLTLVTYALISLAYTAVIFKKRLAAKGKWCKLIARVSEKFVTSYPVVIAATFAFVFITITGALGAAIVYGPDVDPIVQFIYYTVLNMPPAPGI